MLPTGIGLHGGGLTMELLGHTAFSFTFISCLALETMIGSTKTKINWNFLEDVCAWVSGGAVLQNWRCVCVCAQWVSVPMCGLQVYRVLLWVCESVFRLHTKLSWIRENQLERQLWREARGMTKRWKKTNSAKKKGAVKMKGCEGNRERGDCRQRGWREKGNW